jgi:uncharacterized protein (DUF2267 family)
MRRAALSKAQIGYFYDDVWRYERFVTTIEQKAGISWIAAESAARATLQTLAERLSGGEARELAAELPPPLAEWLSGGGENAEPFDAGEFVRRVAEREQVDPETARAHVQAVFIALARLVRGAEIARLTVQLSGDYKRLLGEALRRPRDPSAPEVIEIETFIKRVSRRAALEPTDAHRATEAVLETLAERIAGGEAEDLAEELPEGLRPALERGKERTRGKAQRMSLDEFIERVSEREGVSYEEALDHARAVFATLREAVSDKEVSDLVAELPRGYHEALL